MLLCCFVMFLKILRGAILLAIIIFGVLYFFYQRRAGKLSEKIDAEMKLPKEANDLYKAGAMELFEQQVILQTERLKVLSDRLHKSYNHKEKSNDWLVWSTILLAAAEITISILSTITSD